MFGFFLPQEPLASLLTQRLDPIASGVFFPIFCAMHGFSTLHFSHWTKSLLWSKLSFLWALLASSLALWSLPCFSVFLYGMLSRLGSSYPLMFSNWNCHGGAISRWWGKIYFSHTFSYRLEIMVLHFLKKIDLKIS